MNSQSQTVFDVLKYILVVVLIVLLGLAAVNQVLEYKYRAEFLQRPCQLCANLNKPQAVCIADCFTYRIRVNSDINIPNITLQVIG